MELQKQVCSLELSKRLKELEVKQESLFWWDWSKEHCMELTSETYTPEAISAFTVAELGEMLPDFIKAPDEVGNAIMSMRKCGGNEWSMGYTTIGHGKTVYESINTNEADARAKMLVYLLENNLIKINT